MQENKLSHLILVTQISLFFFVFLFLIPSMADNLSSSKAEVHIVYTERVSEGQEPEAYHIKTLASVVGSEDAAKRALLYIYEHAASGFSATLTAEQVDEISKQPGVLQVVKSQTIQLHSGP
ncbi:peptidase [Striga asiatica]|uniref:Peptidase n=1 Tax=Striga asiatica TaxID=4170 RepID=A0A5A7PCW3_STRAF|nr:peptidase [Striga asiatica]